MPVYRLLSAKNQQRADTIDQPDENSSESSQDCSGKLVLQPKITQKTVRSPTTSKNSSFSTIYSLIENQIEMFLTLAESLVRQKTKQFGIFHSIEVKPNRERMLRVAQKLVQNIWLWLCDFNEKAVLVSTTMAESHKEVLFAKYILLLAVFDVTKEILVPFVSQKLNQITEFVLQLIFLISTITKNDLKRGFAENCEKTKNWARQLIYKFNKLKDELSTLPSDLKNNRNHSAINYAFHLTSQVYKLVEWCTTKLSERIDSGLQMYNKVLSRIKVRQIEIKIEYQTKPSPACGLSQQKR